MLFLRRAHSPFIKNIIKQKQKKQQRCEHIIRKNKQIKSTVLDANKKMNDIIRRALSSAGFNAVLEPVGLDRGDGKRPDGMTLFPFSMGKCLIWDCTCVDSFSPSVLALTATEPGSASRSAEVRKNHKYEGLCDRYIFQAIAVETSCVFGRDTNAFISRLDHLTTSINGERRELSFSANVCHLQQSEETPKLQHKLAAQAHELR